MIKKAHCQFHKQLKQTNLRKLSSIWNIFKTKNFGSYSVISKLGEVSSPLKIPNDVDKPSYYYTGKPMKAPVQNEIKNDSQIVQIKRACWITRQILNNVSKIIKAGTTTDDIDIFVHNEAINFKSYPSPLNYLEFPKSCCTSVNNIACHGIPDNRPLEDGDIISVDVTVFNDGYHGDACETFLVGNVDDTGRALVEIAKKCRDYAIAICAPGVPFTEIGNAVEKIAAEGHVKVVPAFCGHGIGNYFHGPPDIYHCYNNYAGVMQKGMTFTIEPVVAQGSKEILILEDGWTAVMVDNGRAAQFEHTILITESGHEILTNY